MDCLDPGLRRLRGGLRAGVPRRAGSSPCGRPARPWRHWSSGLSLQALTNGGRARWATEPGRGVLPGLACRGGRRRGGPGASSGCA
eukprot:10798169-Lingulodinium_polyedra.AAC.1